MKKYVITVVITLLVSIVAIVLYTALPRLGEADTTEPDTAPPVYDTPPVTEDAPAANPHESEPGTLPLAQEDPVCLIAFRMEWDDLLAVENGELLYAEPGQMGILSQEGGSLTYIPEENAVRYVYEIGNPEEPVFGIMFDEPISANYILTVRFSVFVPEGMIPGPNNFIRGAFYSGETQVGNIMMKNTLGGPELKSSREPHRPAGTGGGGMFGRWIDFTLEVEPFLYTLRAGNAFLDFPMEERGDIDRFIIHMFFWSPRDEFAVDPFVFYFRDINIEAREFERGWAVEPIWPRNSTYMVTDTPTFLWTDTGADYYVLDIFEKARYPETVLRSYNVGAVSSFSLTQPLGLDEKYIWRVTAVTRGENAYGPSLYFHTAMPEPEGAYFYAADFGLIMGEWSRNWLDPNCEIRNGGARRNAATIQWLLDLAGRRGGGTVVLPSGTIGLEGDRNNTQGIAAIEFRYDNLILEGQGRDGPDRTRLLIWEIWSNTPGFFSRRNTGMRVVGTPFANPERAARRNITIRNMELDGGRSHDGNYGWDYAMTDLRDFGWDVRHQGIVVGNDNQVDLVFIDNVKLHRFSGETLYTGGNLVGYLRLSNSIMTDTNASCFNFHAHVLHVYNTQFGSPAEDNIGSRFWIEFCNRESNIQFDFCLSNIPDREYYEARFASIPGIHHTGFEGDTAYFYWNNFYNLVGAEGIVFAQGNATNYTMFFVENEFDNTLDYNRGGNRGMFMFGGSIYGPIYIRDNVFRNVGGYLVEFNWGGGAYDADGNPGHKMNRNAWFEGNRIYNIGGPILLFTGAWGSGFFPYPSQAHEALATGLPYFYQRDGSGNITAIITYSPIQIEDFYFRNNTFYARNPYTPIMVIDASIPLYEDGQRIGFDPMSGVWFNNVEITDNHFIGGTAPEERGPFMGTLPLFARNSYEGLRLTPRGGISILTPDSNVVCPVFEQIVLRAEEPQSAFMRTGVYTHGQEVLVIGDGNTAAVTLHLADNRTVNPGTVLRLRYNAAAHRWDFVSQYRREIFTVTFDGNGGNSLGDATYTRHVVQGLGVGDFPIFLRESHRFMGWNTEPDGSGIEITSACLINEETIFYAVWQSW
ncbi:MAG: InlB B-repeat-containing protein [Defluviitaleaceae bacterium]|nr:InlB B-repeat-containing protein [Defluviitaleaceae bacterium]